MRARKRYWNPYIVVFASSACVMIIELVASRLIAPTLGVSLYTWTSVIGVILAGISLGNYLGGRLADRYASSGFLGVIFALASLGSLSILWLNDGLQDVQFWTHLPLMLWVVGFIAGVFFVPSTILGCVSPIVVKLSLTDLDRTGTTVGKIYAWSSVGSIVGTFATGFWLISWFGTKTIVVLVASLQMLLALWFLTDTSRRKAMIRVLVALATFGLSIWLLYRGDLLCRECLRETNYYCVRVHDREVDERTVRVLVLDRLVHSYSDLEDPTHLAYGYEQVYAEVIRPLVQRKPDLAALFVGGGGYTFPRYLEAILPASRLVVTEIDPEVTEIARALFGLAPDSRIETHDLDTRLYLARQGSKGSFDLVFGDAFNDYSVPFHLTTIEFTRMVAHTLRDDGLYVVNIIDGGTRGHFMRAYITTLQQVFLHVAVIPGGDDWQEARRTTFVLVAGNQPLDLAHLPPSMQPLAEGDLVAYLSLDPPLILSDSYVPVDNLLAPVYQDSARS